MLRYRNISKFLKVGINMYITKYRLVFIGVLIIGLICLTYVSAQHQNDGDTPYTPTRLEWLAVELNINPSPFPGAIVSYIPSRNNTLVLYVLVTSSKMTPALLNQGVNMQKNFILDSAKRRGWDAWLKIKEDVHMSPIMGE